MPALPKIKNDKTKPEQVSITYKRYLILALSAGASLTLGLLSFGGMFALWPALIPAASGFALSVVYEFEIYSQNLTRAFEKLFSTNYFEKQLPKYYLQHYFQKEGISIKQLKEKINILEDASTLTPENINLRINGLQASLTKLTKEKEEHLKTIKTLKFGANSLEKNELITTQQLALRRLGQKTNTLTRRIDTLMMAKTLNSKKITQEIETLKTILEKAKEKTNKRLPFFKEYEKALRTKDSALLAYLEALFDEQINNTEGAYKKSAYRYNKHTEALHAFLRAKGIHQEYKNSAGWRTIYIPMLKAFALLTTLAMSLGTSYLLVEFFSLVPWLAAMPAVLPIIIVPLSVLGGVAYGLLTFNAVTNLMANNTVVNWARKIRNNFSNTLAATATLLFGLALTLTICTAGTWWTIAQQVRPLFGWMRRIPTFFMAVINPVIMWFSSLAFNIENTSGTLHELFPEHDSNDPIDNSPSRWEEIKTAFSNTVKYLWEKENIGQWLNPFRPMLYSVLSLRYILFAGHLFSIGVTADRIPKLSQYVSSCLGGLSEGFEDWDYFFGEHEHPKTLHALLHDRLSESQGHNHDKDLPTKLVALCARPFYHAAAHWDAFFSRFNDDDKAHITYATSWAKLHEAFIPHDENNDEDCCATTPHSKQTESFQKSFQLPRYCEPCIPNVHFFTADQPQEKLGTQAPAPNPVQDEHSENLEHSGCSVM